MFFNAINTIGIFNIFNTWSSGNDIARAGGKGKIISTTQWQSVCIGYSIPGHSI
jgi:hypothetical protein